MTKIIKNIRDSKYNHPNTFKVLAILWLIAMLVMCLAESNTAEISFLAKFIPPEFRKIRWSDKLVHAFIHAFFVLFWHRAFPNKSVWLWVGVSAVLGITIEYLQGAYTTTRSFDLTDELANIVGATLMALLITYYNKRKTQLALQ